MKRKILRLSVFLILLSVLLTGMVSVNLNISSLLEQQKEELLNYCELINQSVSEDLQHGLSVDYSYYATVFSKRIDRRVTFVDQDGTVLGDSLVKEKYKTMENHREREEIKEALLGETGESTRASQTMGNQYLYMALGCKDPLGHMFVTRVAMEVDRIHVVENFLVEASVKSAAVGIVVAAVLSIILASQLTSPIGALVQHSRKIAAGDYKSRIVLHSHDELTELAGTMNDMSEKLLQAATETERAETIRKEFVANVTHELRTPLTSISGFIETLQEGAGENPETRKRFLEILSMETARLKRLIDDILVISDIESGREVNEDLDINVREVIEEIVDALHSVALGRNIAIETNYAYEIYIGGNRDRFKQMILNLVDNAIKYSFDGGTVRIGALKKEGKAVIIIEDQGQGISEEDLPRIFERFYRADKSRSQKVGGTGLGLAISKHIAGLFGGQIQVESKPFTGSRFTVILPQ